MNQTFDEMEIEGKRLLTKNEFVNIQAFFKLSDDDFHMQHNDYFDTSDFQLKAQNAALRIRHKNGEATLTLKMRNEEGVMEKHQPLTENEWTASVSFAQISKGGPVQTYLENEWGIPLYTLHHLGRLSTWRAEWPYEKGVFALDESHYFKKVDYELEFEGYSHNHVKEVLAHVTSCVGIDDQSFEPPPKIQRFFSALYTP